MSSIADFSSDDICSAMCQLTNRRCIVSVNKQIIYLDEGEDLSEEIILNKLIENKNNKPMNELRYLRDLRLQLTDKYVLPDFPITEEKRTEMLNYRIVLRNLPSTLQNQVLDINNLYQYLPTQPTI